MLTPLSLLFVLDDGDQNTGQNPDFSSGQALTGGKCMAGTYTGASRVQYLKYVMAS